MKAIIVAVDENGGIGKDGKLPWHIPEDLKRFKTLTTNTVCIVGYNTYKEIADRFDYDNTGKFLPKRVSYVITSKIIPTVEGYVESFTSIDAALANAKLEESEKDIFFIGGSRIFEEAFKHIDSVYITKLDDDYDCDVFLNLELFEKWREENIAFTITGDYSKNYMFSDLKKNNIGN